MTKIIKPDLIINNIRIKDLDELRQYATADILRDYRSGALIRFLKARNYDGLVLKIREIQDRDDEEILLSICDALGTYAPLIDRLPEKCGKLIEYEIEDWWQGCNAKTSFESELATVQLASTRFVCSPANQNSMGYIVDRRKSDGVFERLFEHSLKELFLRLQKIIADEIKLIIEIIHGQTCEALNHQLYSFQVLSELANEITYYFNVNSFSKYADIESVTYSAIETAHFSLPFLVSTAILGATLAVGLHGSLREDEQSQTNERTENKETVQALLIMRAKEDLLNKIPEIKLAIKKVLELLQNKVQVNSTHDAERQG